MILSQRSAILKDAISKIAALCFIAITTIANGAAAQHLSLDGHEVATSATPFDYWRTPWGSYDRKVVGVKTVEIYVRNFGNAPLKTEVEFYFVSHGAEAGRASREFEFRGPGEFKTRIVSPPAISRTLNLEALGTRTVEGTQPITGWFMIARIGGKIAELKGSDSATQTELARKVRNGTIR